jgi:predicted P-loop ATPase
MPKNTVSDFNYHDYLNNLEPAKTKGKYICPVCSGNDLTISKDGSKISCWSGGCRWQDIRSAITGQQFSPQVVGGGNVPRGARKPNQTMVGAMIECAVDQLCIQVSEGILTKAEALIDLTNQCKAEMWDKFAATQLFNERLKSIKKDEVKPCKTMQFLTAAREMIGDSLAFNELTQRAEYNGNAIDRYKVFCAEKLNMDVQQQTAVEVLEQVAIETRSYHPINDFLDSCYGEFGDTTVGLLDGAIERYTGVRNPLYESFFKHWMISAVQRMKHPGIFTKCVLVLKSRGQSIGKSSFLRLLAHDEMWFTDTPNTGKDESLVNHGKWIIEWSECAQRMTHDQAEKIKQYISSPRDDFRKPYAAHPVSLPRRFALAATTNESEFLNDRTGNVRFWVLDLDECKGIDLKALEQDVRKLWSAAVALYRQGVTWELSQEDLALSEMRNRDYLSVDPWMGAIAEFLEASQLYTDAENEYVTVRHVLDKCLGIETKNVTGKDSKRVEGILRDLGWSALGKQMRIPTYGKNPVSPWVKVTDTFTEPLQPTFTPSNPNTEPNSENCKGCNGGNQENLSLFDAQKDEANLISEVSDHDTITKTETPCTPTASVRNRRCNGLKTNPDTLTPSTYQYVGDRFPQYKDVPLTLYNRSKEGLVNCKTKDGNITTWLYPAELKRV